MKTALGFAQGTDAFEVGKRAAERAKQQVAKPDIAIMYASMAYDQNELFKGVKDTLGSIPVYGTTSPLVITNRGVNRDAVVLMLVESNEINFQIVAGRCNDAPGEIARYLGAQIMFDLSPQPGEKVSCLLTGPESHGRGIDYIEGLKKAWPYPLPISGGATEY